MVSSKGDLLRMYGMALGYVKNMSNSRSLAKVLKHKNLVDIDGVSCK